MRRFLLLLFFAAFTAAAAEKADIVLANGDVLKAARIVAIKGEVVTIVYAEGTRSARAEDVPLDVLARAHMELEAKRKATEAAPAKGVKPRPIDDPEEQAKKDELQFRLAMAKVREQTQTATPVEAGTVQRTPESELMTLKAQFPPKRKLRTSVGIGRRNPLYATRVDTIEIEVPHGDIWNWYRSMVQTTNLQALPRTLRMIDERIARDLAELSRRGSTSDEAASAQSHRTADWLQQDLQAYLQQLRQLAR